MKVNNVKKEMLGKARINDTFQNGFGVGTNAHLPGVVNPRKSKGDQNAPNIPVGLINCSKGKELLFAI